MTEEARVENMIIYMPVEVETVGGTPSSIITGLNTLPPPRPNAPEIQPPKNAKISSRARGRPLYDRSLYKIRPFLSLMSYSRLLMRTPM